MGRGGARGGREWEERRRERKGIKLVRALCV